MSQDLQVRIDKMYKQDYIIVWLNVILLWVFVLFVLYSILDIVTDPGIRIALYASSFVLLVFNTASVRAMTKHLNDDKQFIYGLDIQNLDSHLIEKATKGLK